MGQTSSNLTPTRKLTKANRNGSSSTTRLVRNSTRSTRNTVPSSSQPSSPASSTFPPSIYSPTLTYNSSSPSIASPITPVFPVTPTPVRQSKRLSDLHDVHDAPSEYELPVIDETPCKEPAERLRRHVSIGDPNIVRIIPPPQEKNRLSDILDPLDVLTEYEGRVIDHTPSPPRKQLVGGKPRHVSLGEKGIVHSPSGNMLGVFEFVGNPNRPLAVWERQERIKSAAKEQFEKMDRLEMESRAGTRLTFRKGEEKKKRRGCCSFLGN